MPRLMLSDEHWMKLLPILKQVRINDNPALRLSVEGMLYRIRTGCPWRDLPAAFGKWNTVFTRFNEWSAKGKWLTIFRALVQDPDLEWMFIDGSYTKAHQHSSGAASGKPEAIGKSRAGLTSKIHMAVDGFGLPIGFEVSGGEINDCTAAPDLLDQAPQAEVVIADKGYDSQKVRNKITEKGAAVVIPRRKGSKTGNQDMDWHLYKHRHLVENIFARLKHFRGLATRYDKLKRNYVSVVAMACCIVWLPM
ncbi:IS5 family transposase [Sansalvadorimonas verongulae]|uniref:IS5 family transposase n=1 Tax=Sansalvadorimonas verongulae TaxID=2172824 RepID=UPI0012BC1831|nr:IS5 family transposase [Sansalvadorimonas verongulae]MTI11659.1 IS5 family transposase [Sansalvadorimonas verongulae]